MGMGRVHLRVLAAPLRVQTVVAHCMFFEPIVADSSWRRFLPRRDLARGVAGGFGSFRHLGFGSFRHLRLSAAELHAPPFCTRRAASLLGGPGFPRAVRHHAVHVPHPSSCATAGSR